MIMMSTSRNYNAASFSHNHHDDDHNNDTSDIGVRMIHHDLLLPCRNNDSRELNLHVFGYIQDVIFDPFVAFVLWLLRFDNNNSLGNDTKMINNETMRNHNFENSNNIRFLKHSSIGFILFIGMTVLVLSSWIILDNPLRNNKNNNDNVVIASSVSRSRGIIAASSRGSISTATTLTTITTELSLSNEDTMQQHNLNVFSNTNRILVEPKNCITNDIQLRTAIEAAPIATPTTIDICQSYVKMDIGQYTIVGKNIIIQCNLENMFAFANVCTLDAQGFSRHFVISNSNVQFKNLIFINGLPKPNIDPGGSVYITRSNTELIRCTFNNNTSDSAGSALYIELSNVTMIGNSDRKFLGPTMLFVNNTSNNGIISIRDSSLYINHVTFSNNLAYDSCAGIVSLSNLVLNMNNTLFDENYVIIPPILKRKRRELISSISSESQDHINSFNDIKNDNNNNNNNNNSNILEEDETMMLKTKDRRRLGTIYDEPRGGSICISNGKSINITNTIFQNTFVYSRSSVMEIFHSIDTTVKLKNIVISNTFSKTGGSLIFLDTVSNFIMSNKQLINNKWNPIYGGAIRTFDTTLTLGKNIVFKNNTLRNNTDVCDYFVLTAASNDDTIGSCIALPIF